MNCLFSRCSAPALASLISSLLFFSPLHFHRISSGPSLPHQRRPRETNIWVSRSRVLSRSLLFPFSFPFSFPLTFSLISSFISSFISSLSFSLVFSLCALSSSLYPLSSSLYPLSFSPLFSSSLLSIPSAFLDVPSFCASARDRQYAHRGVVSAGFRRAPQNSSWHIPLICHFVPTTRSSGQRHAYTPSFWHIKCDSFVPEIRDSLHSQYTQYSSYFRMVQAQELLLKHTHTV